MFWVATRLHVSRVLKGVAASGVQSGRILAAAFDPFACWLAGPLALDHGPRTLWRIRQGGRASAGSILDALEEAADDEGLIDSVDGDFTFAPEHDEGR